MLSAEKLATEENVVGFDSLNEPNLGMIGWDDLSKGSKFLKQGPSPIWFESFQLGEGFEKSVAYYNPSLVKAGQRILNSNKVRAWKEGHTCVWKQHGVWDIMDTARNGRTPVLLQKDYFHWRYVSGRRVKVDLAKDYFVSFAMRFQAAINEAAARGGGSKVRCVSKMFPPIFPHMVTLTPIDFLQMLVFLDRYTNFEDPSIGHCPTGINVLE